jgi:hypothetical protein
MLCFQAISLKAGCTKLKKIIMKKRGGGGGWIKLKFSGGINLLSP